MVALILKSLKVEIQPKLTIRSHGHGSTLHAQGIGDLQLPLGHHPSLVLLHSSLVLLHSSNIDGRPLLLLLLLNDLPDAVDKLQLFIRYETQIRILVRAVEQNEHFDVTLFVLVALKVHTSSITLS